MALDNITAFFAGGFERAQAGAIDSNGYFIGSAITLANGANSGMLQLQGANSADVPTAGQRVIQPEGDDGVVGRIKLPGINEIAFPLNLKVFDATFAALVQGTKAYAVEEWTMVDFDPYQPTYPTLCMLFTRKASSKVSGSPGSGYENLLLFACKASFSGAGGLQSGANDATYSFDVTVDRSTKTPWGDTLSIANDGTTQSSGKLFWSENRVSMHAFKGNASLTNFAVTYTPSSAVLNTKNLVFKNGTKQTTGVTISGKTFTFGAAPANGDNVVVVYEHDYS